VGCVVLIERLWKIQNCNKSFSLSSRCFNDGNSIIIMNKFNLAVRSQIVSALSYKCYNRESTHNQ
jgi:hypothetical protein